MVVVAGVTVTAVPLDAARFPGVITPVPPEKTPVRVALFPSTMVAGFATKLVIEAGGVLFPPPELDPPQPLKTAKPQPHAMAQTAKTESRLISFPLC